MAAVDLAATAKSVRTRKPIYKQIYFWVIVGITAGILVGHFNPALGIALGPIGVAFVNLIKMVIAPVIFCTVVGGIASIVASGYGHRLRRNIRASVLRTG